MKKKFTKEIRIGLAFIVALFLLYFGINFLKGVNIFKPANSYYVIFSDVSGLTISSPVLLNGYQIGLVYSMEMNEKNSKEIVTVLNLNKGVKIPVGSVVKMDVEMLGGAKVIVEPNYASTEFYTANDTIYGIRDIGLVESLSANLMPGVESLIPKIDSILTGLQYAVNHPALDQSLNNMGHITSDLQISTRQLNILLNSVNRNVPEITSNLAEMTGDLKRTTNQLNSMDLSATYNSIDSTLKNIHSLSEKINSRDNSIGLLLNDRQLYDSITSTLNNASLLLRDVKENPSRYINVKVF